MLFFNFFMLLVSTIFVPTTNLKVHQGYKAEIYQFEGIIRASRACEQSRVRLLQGKLKKWK
jgi:hypothetical protein